RQHYHHRIAQVLEVQFPETTQTQPELLAHHFTEAGLTDQAVQYWYKAGQSAVQRSAHEEAISHLRQGLALLQTLPETPQRLQLPDGHIFYFRGSWGMLGTSAPYSSPKSNPWTKESNMSS